MVTDMSENSYQISTSKFFCLLFKTPNLEQFIEDNAIEMKFLSFSGYITELCKRQGNVAERVIKRANIERSFGHQIFKGSRNPSRDTVLQLAFGFEADIDMAQDLLKHAGMSTLYPRMPRDAAVIYCLHHHFSIMETQQVLHELGLPLLGSGRIK
jgi:transcriptional regulator with XRE-family HTH domain